MLFATQRDNRFKDFEGAAMCNRSFIMALVGAIAVGMAGQCQPSCASPQALQQRPQRRGSAGSLVFKDHVAPYWFAGNRQFWYRNGRVLTSADSGVRSPATE